MPWRRWRQWTSSTRKSKRREFQTWASFSPQLNRFVTNHPLHPNVGQRMSSGKPIGRGKAKRVDHKKMAAAIHGRQRPRLAEAVQFPQGPRQNFTVGKNLYCQIITAKITGLA